MARKGQTTVEFDERFFATIMRSAGVQALQKEKAEAALRVAQSTAPVDTGAYRNGLEIKKVAHKYRDTFQVEGTDAKTLLIESKTGNLARALKAVKSS